MSSVAPLDRFYALMGELADRCGGYRFLRSCDGRSAWPERGVYFFFDEGERRASGDLRVVRVGTHALTNASRTTLWKRLSQHRGNVGGARPGGGNHRGSVFRLHTGEAMLATGGWSDAIGSTWARAGDLTPDFRDAEYPLEQAVSACIGALPLLWVAVDDPPRPTSDRAVIEAGAIALLSNRRGPIDDPSPSWLGRTAQRATIRESGLWNVRHVDDPPSADFLDVFSARVRAMP
jgi:hypothetical protein